LKTGVQKEIICSAATDASLIDGAGHSEQHSGPLEARARFLAANRFSVTALRVEKDQAFMMTFDDGPRSSRSSAVIPGELATRY